jgi:drug/metabolite transporter superfamily protein YnfA
VVTALWFRSRLIVVANFFIYVVIVLTYMFMVRQETGISVGFGVVALLTARILNWKKERLELKTELMRNAYLASAFVVFPYALFHLVPRAYVGLAWIGVALGYYLMNLIIRNPKYRWMGHLTLLLTVLYVIVNGFTQLAPTYRIVSFLALGSVLVVVSLIFTQIRARRKPVLKDKSE